MGMSYMPSVCPSSTSTLRIAASQIRLTARGIDSYFRAMPRRLYPRQARRLAFEALVRQLVGACVEADVVELLLGVSEDDTSLGHAVDLVRRHVQMLSKAERPSFYLDDFAVHVGDRTDLPASSLS